MFLITVMCSDPECIEEREIAAENLDEVEVSVCDCGYSFLVVAVTTAA
jgi:hypothetical protein